MTGRRGALVNRPPWPAVVVSSFLAGSVPYSGLAARVVSGVDLRRVGSGTVSGTGLYQVAGFAPLAVAGALDVAKGVVGPVLAGPDRPGLGAVAAGATICGHNWSPFLGGAGGRGVSPALGALGVLAPEGAVLMAGSLVAGRLVRQTGVATFVALALLPALGVRRGRAGLLLSGCVVVPMLAKRLAGNRPPPLHDLGRTLLSRLVFDRDPFDLDGPPDGGGTSGEQGATDRRRWGR